MNISKYNHMIIKYSIKVVNGNEWFEATSKYLPDVIEYGDTRLEAYMLLCDTIMVTEEHLGKKLID
jgi:hypothetical protein